MQKEASRDSAWAPLALPVFRVLWLAQLGSNIGVWMQTVGAQWFLVEQTHSSALVAWVQTASLLPVLLLSLLAGVLADAYDRRILLLATTTVSTVAAAVLTLITATGNLQPWSLLLMTFLIGCGTALTAPAWQAIQPELVPRNQLTAAASLGSVTINGARAVGPAIGGVLVALGGPALVFGLNAISFAGVITALATWQRPPQKGLDHRERLFPALAAGLRYVKSGDIIRRILLRSALFAFPACALWALLPSAARTHLGLGASGYGILLGILGVGALIGVAVVPYLRRTFSSSVILAGSAAAFALGTVSIALWPFAIVCALFVVSGIAWIATLTTLNAAMQLSLAHWVRARGMSIYLLVFMGSQAIGSFVWGALSTTVGETVALLTAAGALVVVALTVTILPLRAGTGTLDRDVVALCAAAPILIFEPQPDDGPVSVVFNYHVAPDHSEAFVAAMRAVAKSRRRTGATSWRLERSGEEAGLFREEFTVRSWDEFQRQGTDRWTRSDQDTHERAMALAQQAPGETHYFPV
ncbi:MFS transporter (plasmid) [Arthrobacter sp. ERGS1:01]|uniref:MFS transporter n=1 Tax=Arthrobacter sp. ERGS1:01 TaxID=1704044 RepID=UPI0006B56465|nr:MFS transporter [Arthrobacter sp. ERGS1:01]ALE04640.1 MFS transporter [Arthrobacter sp. ERGS1:01]